MRHTKRETPDAKTNRKGNREIERGREKQRVKKMQQQNHSRTFAGAKSARTEDYFADG